MNYGGREYLAANFYSQLLVDFRVLCIARNGYRIRKGEEQVGWITSGTISPVTREGIAMGWVDAQYSEIDEQLGIEIRGEVFPATEVQMPFLEDLKK